MTAQLDVLAGDAVRNSLHLVYRRRGNAVSDNRVDTLINTVEQ